ncbi:hypothetical protein FHG87_021985 [Trinorchestia longiramus]|nr:hypothetical protein FHG87_021985 [Trinorchestia longiramus]
MRPADKQSSISPRLYKLVHPTKFLRIPSVFELTTSFPSTAKKLIRMKASLLLLLVLGLAYAAFALPPPELGASMAGVPPTTKPPGIPPAVVDLISSRLDALATGAVPGAPVPPAAYAAIGKPAAVPAPGMPPAVAKLVKSMLKSYAVPAVA